MSSVNAKGSAKSETMVVFETLLERRGPMTLTEAMRVSGVNPKQRRHILKQFRVWGWCLARDDNNQVQGKFFETSCLKEVREIENNGHE